MRSRSDAKTALRRLSLRQLRSCANPSALRGESEQLCARLHKHVLALRHSHESSPLLVCGFLPMPYELDLRPLFANLWNARARDEVRTFVPAVLPGLPSAMLFVEMTSEPDLCNACAPRQPYGIVEPTEKVLAQLLADKSPVPRRCFACDTWDALFSPRLSVPKAFAPPEASACLLVLTPGVRFANDGTRIGKGGGYYDRFLRYHRRVGTRVVAWGIARDMQLASESLPSVRGGKWNDELVNAVVTPTRFVPCEALKGD